MGGWMGGWMMNGEIDGCMDGWMDGWMDDGGKQPVGSDERPWMLRQPPSQQSRSSSLATSFPGSHSFSPFSPSSIPDGSLVVPPVSCLRLIGRIRSHRWTEPFSRDPPTLPLLGTISRSSLFLTNHTIIQNLFTLYFH